MDTGQPPSLFKRLGLLNFAQTREMRPSQRIAMHGSELLKGIVTERPMVPEDKLMFDRKSISKTKNPLAKLFRLIMYKLRMTPDDYRAKAVAYGSTLGKTGAEMTTALSNARKAIYGENLTIMQLERNLLFADYDILDLAVTIQNHETGEISQYKLSDISTLIPNTAEEIDQLVESDEDTSSPDEPEE